MDQDLSQRKILISGAAGTLGRVGSLACAAAGATVILLDKHLGNLERLYDEIVSAGNPTPALYPVDLEGATEADFAELASSIERELGGLHGLLHAANEAGILGPITDLRAREVERAWRVNCSAPLQLTRALLPLLGRTGKASIVFVSDTAARTGKAYWGAYGISKIALEGLAHILAEETAAAGRIQVHTFLPGPFQSPVHLRAFPGRNRAELPDAAELGPKLVALLAGGDQSGPLAATPFPQPGQAHVR